MSGYVKGEDGVWREPPGYAALWNWFGCSRASWLTMPRAFMHEMPDRWQRRMAVLLREWDETWKWPDEMPLPSVTAKVGNHYTRWPKYVLNYRHPDSDFIATFKTSGPQAQGTGEKG